MSDVPAWQVPIHERIDKDYGFSTDTTDEQQTKAKELRKMFADVAHDLVDIAPSSRERSMALNKLQEAKMWAVQSIFSGEN